MADLERYLQQLGQAKIMEMLGSNYVQQITELSTSLKESILSKILLAKYGVASFLTKRSELQSYRFFLMKQLLELGKV